MSRSPPRARQGRRSAVRGRSRCPSFGRLRVGVGELRASRATCPHSPVSAPSLGRQASLRPQLQAHRTPAPPPRARARPYFPCGVLPHAPTPWQARDEHAAPCSTRGVHTSPNTCSHPWRADVDDITHACGAAGDATGTSAARHAEQRAGDSGAPRPPEARRRLTAHASACAASSRRVESDAPPPSTDQRTRAAREPRGSVPHGHGHAHLCSVVHATRPQRVVASHPPRARRTHSRTHARTHVRRWRARRPMRRRAGGSAMRVMRLRNDAVTRHPPPPPPPGGCPLGLVLRARGGGREAAGAGRRARRRALRTAPRSAACACPARAAHRGP